MGRRDRRATSLEERARPTRETVGFLPWRLAIFALFSIAVLTLFGLRIYYLTVLRGPYFYELSENNYLSTAPVPAPRGRILSSDGATLALNRIVYDVQMGPYGMEEDEIQASLDRLSVMLHKPELRDKAQDVIDFRPKWKRITLFTGLELSEVVPVMERAWELPGVVLDPQFTRSYPFSHLTAHVTGYEAALTPEQYKARKEEGYLLQDNIGKLGIERQYETSLRGKHGQELFVRDAHGRPRSSRIEVSADRGNDVILTLDMRLQALTDALMEGHKGVAIAMDPNDGSILALVSKLDFDPNNPLRGSGSGRTSSYNKAFRGRYAPASTFKLITAAAGLASGRYPDEEIYCPGNYRLQNYNRPFWCDVRWGHGSLDLQKAIQKSCNVYFYKWADQLGLERLIETSRGFGFGVPTGIDLVPEGLETTGVLGPGPGQTVYRGSVIQMGIGQGVLIAVTPMQLLNAYAALGNGGILWQPHLFKEARSPIGEVVTEYEPQAIGRVPLDETQRQILLEGFRRVVQSVGGTAYTRGFQKEWNAAGKTGSAEVAGQKLTNGWFVSFAPMEAPEIAIIVLVEAEGHGGATAAPIVREMMATWFDRENPAKIDSGRRSILGVSSEGGY